MKNITYKPDHTAISVSDLDRSVQWYNNILGFEESQRFDIPNMNARAAFIEIPGYKLEVFEVRGGNPLPEYRHELGSDLRTMGTKHIAFSVDDINEAYQSLTGKGVEFLFEPKQGRSGRKYAFFKDPDGILLEIIGD